LAARRLAEILVVACSSIAANFCVNNVVVAGKGTGFFKVVGADLVGNFDEFDVVVEPQTF